MNNMMLSYSKYTALAREYVELEQEADYNADRASYAIQCGNKEDYNYWNTNRHANDDELAEIAKKALASGISFAQWDKALTRARIWIQRN